MPSHSPTSRARTEAELPDPNYVDDGGPVEITLDQAHSFLWTEDSVKAQRFRTGYVYSAARISTQAGGRDVKVRTNLGGLLLGYSAAGGLYHMVGALGGAP